MRRAVVWAFAALSVLVASNPVGTAEHVDLSELFQILPWDTLHTITKPRFEDGSYLSPADQVIGVSIGHESHAYPIKLMNYHEVIDDVVGGIPIVVSWCPLCGTAIAYERTVDGEVLTFRTSGYLYRNNKVMFDVQTASLWPQILGEAINGTYHGTRLRLVTTARMAYRDWVTLQPDTKVVGRPWGPVLCPLPCAVPPGFEGYEIDPYADYQAANWTYADVRHPDARFHPKMYVAGVVLNGDAWAVTFPDLLRHRAVNAIVGGVPIVVAHHVDLAFGTGEATSAHAYEREAASFHVENGTNDLVDETGIRYAILSGVGTNDSLKPISFFYGFWFAWHDYHPETRLFGVEPEVTPGGFSLGPNEIGIAGIIAAGSYIAARRCRQSRRGSR